MKQDDVPSMFITFFITVIIIAFYIGYGIGSKFNSSSPVEENKVIDSLQTVNKTIIVEVEHLDSIKNEEIIKVKTLDNDSTLKLFYSLLGK